MIVGKSFEGDDAELSRRQADVYSEALRIVIEGCRGHLVDACLMLGIPFTGFWPEERSTDHRTMQVGHDILAAAWRAHVRPAEPELAFEAQNVASSMSSWLEWLRTEVASWTRAPAIIACVRTIILHQNSEFGYEAEDHLTRLLLGRSHQIDWTTTTAKAFQTE